MLRWIQYNPWYIKLNLEDRRIQLALLVSVLFILIIILPLAISLGGQSYKRIKSKRIAVLGIHHVFTAPLLTKIIQQGSYC